MLLVDLSKTCKFCQKKSGFLLMGNPRKRDGTLDEVVDMELNCLCCGTRLSVPIAIARDIVAIVQKGGTAMLICSLCKHVQSIRQKRQKRMTNLLTGRLLLPLSRHVLAL